MSDRLMEMMKRYIEKSGHNGMAKLSVASEIGTTTIHKVLNGHIPLPKNARDLALACGASEKVAREIEQECATVKARESA